MNRQIVIKALNPTEVIIRRGTSSRTYTPGSRSLNRLDRVVEFGNTLPFVTRFKLVDVFTYPSWVYLRYEEKEQ